MNLTCTDCGAEVITELSWGEASGEELALTFECPGCGQAALTDLSRPYRRSTVGEEVRGGEP